MTDPQEVSRRGFLGLGAAAGLLSLTPAAVLLGRALPSQSSARGIRLEILNRTEARRLLTVTRTIFPHDFLSDDTYLKIVGALDAKAAADASLVSTLRAGLSELPGEFTAMNEGAREEHLRGMESSEFFLLVHEATQTGLYGDPTVAALFGYEGSSVQRGGYLKRGFDDLDWLPGD